ncbi:MAG: 50S ribosomal protein L9 [Planctomycetota bacterium]|nr:MAG: 50S ribosomal protein L9 [Planctomycetota bacterium]
MELLLKQSIHKLGFIGDIVSVKAGYARNYLLPQGKAIRITDANKNEVAQQKKLLAVKKEEELTEKRSLAEKINEISLELKYKVNEENNLYGSVSEADIVNALSEKGITVDRRTVRFEEAIRSTGEFSVLIHLAPDVESTLKISILSDEQQ